MGQAEDVIQYVCALEDYVCALEDIMPGDEGTDVPVNFWPSFPIIMTLDSLVKEIPLAVSEVHALISENWTLSSKWICQLSIICRLHGLPQLSVKKNNQGGQWGFYCDFKKHVHGDNGSVKGSD